MKKIVLIIIIFFVLSNNTIIKSKEVHKPGLYYVELDNLTIDNIDSLVTDQIIAVEPYVNPLYKNCTLIDYETTNKLKEAMMNFYEINNIKESKQIKRIIVYSKNELNPKYKSPKKVTEFHCNMS